MSEEMKRAQNSKLNSEVFKRLTKKEINHRQEHLKQM